MTESTTQSKLKMTPSRQCDKKSPEQFNAETTMNAKRGWKSLEDLNIFRLDLNSPLSDFFAMNIRVASGKRKEKFFSRPQAK